MNLTEFNAVLGSVAAEFAATELTSDQYFMWAIHKQNSMYSLPIQTEPTLNGLGETPSNRINGFLKTLGKEFEEGREVIVFTTVREWMHAGHSVSKDQLEELFTRLNVGDEKRRDPIRALLYPIIEQHDTTGIDRWTLVAIADWLADITVYVRSEALKFGIPLEAVQNAVMGSNFTKLGADGQPIKDENGKVQKGPNFIPPEDHIYALMFQSASLLNELSAKQAEMNDLNTLAAPTIFDPMSYVHAAISNAAPAADDEAEIEDEGEDADYEVHDEIPEGEGGSTGTDLFGEQ